MIDEFITRKRLSSFVQFVLASVVLTLASCGGSKDEIRTYRLASGDAGRGASPEAQATVAIPSAAPPVSAADRGEPTDRMMAAILGGSDRVWFFKGVGPIDSITSFEEPLQTLFRSINVSGAEPEWALPTGWSEQGPSGMRRATLVSPATSGAKPIEVTVIDLPKIGDWRSQLLDNVNRWRGQMGQKPLQAAELSESVTELGSQTTEQDAVLVDIVGWFSGGMAPGAPPRRAAPPVTAGGSPPNREGLSFDTPEGWAVEPGSAMRKASFKTEAGSEVTAFVFSAAAQGMADPLENVNRWRAQNNLDSTTASQLEEDTEQMELGGSEATYVELPGATHTTFAAMTARGGQVWFFKLRGLNAATEQDREAFRAWLETVSF